MTFLLAFLGSLAGSCLGFWIIFKTWKFPRIIVVPMEKVEAISKEIKEGKYR